ncbi:helix-turn-helix domain-containing protein [Ramlibacter sp. AW1]|uniref:Helix-turn-helix domain-containing protein n=1 Tax=Ramlibacter aurantiacus TaxID=2801330 RepID=A0A937D482_9BURK|nr:IclR family transcriptional regulator C-terminal domain-containing protein [Ramlibacter aurantiacus]MBL0420067.1 helix-turn-helix domain-containing protein [Ramlibacter aurantiacus]
MPAATQPPRNKDRIAGLAKGLRLLEAFDSAHTRMTITEAARRIDVSLAAARRCLLTLCELGYMQTDGKHFWLGHGALRISYAYAASTRLPRLVQPALDSLSERSRDSASLAVLHEGAVVIAARSTARRTFRVGLGVGSRLPLHCSAAGRVLLADLPGAQARKLLASTQREAFTPRTVTDLRGLMQGLQECRARGWAACDEEIELGVRSIAVPLGDASGQTVAALTISTRAERMTTGEMVAAYLPAMRRTQEWVRARL